MVQSSTTTTPADAYFKPANDYGAALFGPINRAPGTVTAGTVETTIGRFEAANLPDGLSLTVAGQGFSGANAVTVLSGRLVGRSTFVRVGCEGGKAKGGFELRARIPGVFLPELGSAVLVQINPSQAFVFPAR